MIWFISFFLSVSTDCYQHLQKYFTWNKWFLCYTFIYFFCQSLCSSRQILLLDLKNNPKYVILIVVFYICQPLIHGESQNEVRFLPREPFDYEWNYIKGVRFSREQCFHSLLSITSVREKIHLEDLFYKLVNNCGHEIHGFMENTYTRP